MTPEQFCYWMQGFAEINGKEPTPEQWEVIKEHLGLVFNKVTTKQVQPTAPIYPGPTWPTTPPITLGPKDVAIC